MAKALTRQTVLLVVSVLLILLVFVSNNGLPTGNVAAPQQAAVNRFTIVYASNPQASGEQAYPTANWPLSPGRFTIDFKRNFAADRVEGIRRCDYYYFTLSRKFRQKEDNGNFCKFMVGREEKTIGPFVIAADSIETRSLPHAIEVDMLNPTPGERYSKVDYQVLYKLASTNDWEWGNYCQISTDPDEGGRSTCRVNLPRATNILAVMVARAQTGESASVSVTDIRTISYLSVRAQTLKRIKV